MFKKVIVLVFLLVMVSIKTNASPLTLNQVNYRALQGYTILEVGKIKRTRSELSKYKYIQMPSGNWYKVNKIMSNFDWDWYDLVIFGRVDGDKITIKILNLLDNQICNAFIFK